MQTRYCPATTKGTQNICIPRVWSRLDQPSIFFAHSYLQLQCVFGGRGLYLGTNFFLNHICIKCLSVSFREKRPRKLKHAKFRGGGPSESFFKCPLYRLEVLSLLFYSLTAFAHVQSSHRCYTSSAVVCTNTLFLHREWLSRVLFTIFDFCGSFGGTRSKRFPNLLFNITTSFVSSQK